MTIDGHELFRCFQFGAKEVYKNKKYLNAINVFPVADGDTGTNLSITLSGMIEFSHREQSFHQMLKNMSDAALAHAHGNSGILFASYVNGLAVESQNLVSVSISDFATIATNAVSHLYTAVSVPVEGTIITVIRDWALYLKAHAKTNSDFRELFTNAYICATDSLEKTKNQISVLKKNQLVDSGAKGFVTFLNGINQYLNGTTIEVEGTDEILSLQIEEESGQYRYCTEVYFKFRNVKNKQKDLAHLKEKIAEYGDSLLLSMMGEKVRLHIHTNVPEKVVAQVRPYGQIMEQKADDMFLQSSVKKNRISSIGILTDSIADIPDAFKLEHQIHTLPIGLSFEDTIFLDKRTITLTELADMMQQKSDYPGSSQPEPTRVEAMIENMLERYESIIIVSVSSLMSGTYQTFNRAVQKYKQNGQQITLIDSRLNSGAQGLLLYEAANLIRQGKSHQEIVANIENMISKTKIYVCLNTLAYAVRSGRVPNTVGKIGIFFGLRPIMTIDELGSGSAFGIGFSQKSITNQIMKQVKKKRNSIRIYSIVHADNQKLAEEYRKQLQLILGKEPVFITEISSVVALHSGIGSVAICFTEEGEL